MITCICNSALFAWNEEGVSENALTGCGVPQPVIWQQSPVDCFRALPAAKAVDFNSQHFSASITCNCAAPFELPDRKKCETVCVVLLQVNLVSVLLVRYLDSILDRYSAVSL